MLTEKVPEEIYRYVAVAWGRSQITSRFRGLGELEEFMT